MCGKGCRAGDFDKCHEKKNKDRMRLENDEAEVHREFAFFYSIIKKGLSD